MNWNLLKIAIILVSCCTTLVESNGFQLSTQPLSGSSSSPSLEAGNSAHQATERRYLPEFKQPMPNQTVTLGSEAVLSCHVTHLGGYRVGWIKSDSKAIQAIHTHVITHNVRVSVRHHGHELWQLVISDVQREDEGFFMCQINTDPMKSQVAYLRVVVPPEIDATGSTNHDVMTSEGSSIKLSCKARGDPTPVVRWHREDGEDITIRNVNGERLRFSTYEGETLTLMKISRLDMGVYVCTASNGIPPVASRRISVNINFNPVINVPNQLIWSTTGNNFSMECYVEAYPRSVNYWIRGDGELIISGSKFGVSEVRDSIFASRMSLTVHNFDKSDIGKYRCIAKNSLGEVEGRIHVYESNAWPRGGTTTLKSVHSSEYEEEDPEEERRASEADFHKRQHHYRRGSHSNPNDINEINETIGSEEEEDELHEKENHLLTTERTPSSWRFNRNSSSCSLKIHTTFCQIVTFVSCLVSILIISFT